MTNAQIALMLTLVFLGLIIRNEVKKFTFKKKYTREYVFYSYSMDQILIRKMTPTQCVKYINASTLTFLGEL